MRPMLEATVLSNNPNHGNNSNTRIATRAITEITVRIVTIAIIVITVIVGIFIIVRMIIVIIEYK